MTRLLLRLLLLTALPGLAAPASAQSQDVRSVRVQFPSGQTGTTIRDTIVGYESVAYQLSASEGQVMTVALAASNFSTYFNVYGPGQGPGGQAIATSDVTGAFVPEPNRFETRLRGSGAYTVLVYQVRAAARRGERSSYTLNVSITGRAVQLPGGDTVGGAGQGEPGFWRVSGVGAGDRLNVRTGPSIWSRVLYTLRNGDIVRNRGCTIQAGGVRWCQVNRIGQPGITGWASARFLVPARDPGGSATQLPGAAAIPGTQFHATGTLSCSLSEGAPMGTCSFGVIRRGNGNATLVVQLPRGGERRISFEAGRPVSANSPAGVWAEWSGNIVQVHIGTAERYHVPNTVIFGGATQLPGDAAVPGTGFHATGVVSCTVPVGTFTQSCGYGVIRRGNGNATLVVQLPGGGERRIVFEAGRPVSANSPGGVRAEWSGDTVHVFVGATERYYVPNFVIYGG